MKNRFPALTAVGLLFVGSLWADSNAKIQTGGQLLLPEKAAIVLPDVASAQENYAADDLAKHLKLITGAEFAKVSESSFNGPQGFYLGNTRKAAACGVNLKELGEEGIHLKTDGASVILAGGKRGAIYAVSVFLEDVLGCRWFAPDCATWPTRGTIDVPRLDRRYLPPLEFRSTDLGAVRSDGNIPQNLRQAHNEYAVHLRLNGHYNNTKEEMGGFHPIGKSHALSDTFFTLVPPKKYFKDHPEYYSMVGGKRSLVQLCMSNTEVVDVVVESLRNQIRENPQSRIFSVCQQDGLGCCQCDKCTAVQTAEGSWSGPLIHFINAIADRIGREYPDVFLLTQAYAYSIKAPKTVRPRPNVIVCLTPVGGVDPYAEDSSMVANLRRWAECCERLYIYEYNANFGNYLTPVANWYAQKPNLQLYLKNKVKGVFQQGCPYPDGEFNALRAYLAGKLLWDPLYDSDVAIKEFCEAYYGTAAPLIQEYMRRLYAIAVRPLKKGEKSKNYTYEESDVTELWGLIERAKATVKNNPDTLSHVEKVCLSALYLQLAVGKRLNVVVEKDGRLVQSGRDLCALAREFEALTKRHGVVWMGENGSNATVDGFLAGLPKTADLEIVELRNPILGVQILPGLGGRIYQMTHLPTGYGLFVKKQSLDPPYVTSPEVGGYTERIGVNEASPGVHENFDIVERRPNTLIMEGVLRGEQCKIRRTYELDPVKPVLKVTSTLINIQDKAGSFYMVATPVFRVGSLARNIHILEHGEKWKAVKMQGLKAFSGEELRGDRRPDGLIALELNGKVKMPVRDKNTGRVCNFRDADIDFVIAQRFEPVEALGMCIWNVPPGVIRLPLYWGSRTLAPGESMTKKISFEITTMEKLQSEKKHRIATMPGI